MLLEIAANGDKTDEEIAKQDDEQQVLACVQKSKSNATSSLSEESDAFSNSKTLSSGGRLNSE